MPDSRTTSPSPRELLTLAFTPPRPPVLRQEAELLATTTARFMLRLPDDARFGRAGGSVVQGYAWGAGAAEKSALLMHGWGGRATVWGAFVAGLTGAGYRVVALDAPAHGASDGEISSGPAFAHAIASCLACEYELRGKPFDAVVAHSWGALATTTAFSMLCAPEILPVRAVFLAPLCHVDPTIERFMRDEPGADEANVREAMRIFATEFDGQERTAAKLLSVPLLILHDEADADVPFAEGQTYAESWRNARIASVAGVGHRRILRAKSVLAETLAFLKQRLAAD